MSAKQLIQSMCCTVFVEADLHVIRNLFKINLCLNLGEFLPVEFGVKLNETVLVGVKVVS